MLRVARRGVSLFPIPRRCSAVAGQRRSNRCVGSLQSSLALLHTSADHQTLAATDVRFGRTRRSVLGDLTANGPGNQRLFSSSSQQEGREGGGVADADTGTIFTVDHRKYFRLASGATLIQLGWAVSLVVGPPMDGLPQVG